MLTLSTENAAEGLPAVGDKPSEGVTAPGEGEEDKDDEDEDEDDDDDDDDDDDEDEGEGGGGGEDGGKTSVATAATKTTPTTTAENGTGDGAGDMDEDGDEDDEDEEEGDKPDPKTGEGKTSEHDDDGEDDGEDPEDDLPAPPPTHLDVDTKIAAAVGNLMPRADADAKFVTAATLKKEMVELLKIVTDIVTKTVRSELAKGGALPAKDKKAEKETGDKKAKKETGDKKAKKDAADATKKKRKREAEESADTASSDDDDESDASTTPTSKKHKVTGPAGRPLSEVTNAKEYQYFGSHSKKNSILSNFAMLEKPIVMKVDGEKMEFPTAEHAYQSGKFCDPSVMSTTGILGDPETAWKSVFGPKAEAMRKKWGPEFFGIVAKTAVKLRGASRKADECKEVTLKCSNKVVFQSNEEIAKYVLKSDEVFYQINMARARRNVDMRQVLLDTGDAYLVEMAQHAKMNEVRGQGVEHYGGYVGVDPETNEPILYGLNRMGEIMMRVRADIPKRIEEAKSRKKLASRGGE
jgi:predicted NAD-dependent protein-ADP-ribosyltransferase YbiA (DUF1768 family)